VIEESPMHQCWRSHRDRFLAKGGRVLTGHSVVKARQDGGIIKELYLKNDKGTMILPVDVVVLSSRNQEYLNSPMHWKEGLFFLQRRFDALDPSPDEERWLDQVDWKETFWRVSKALALSDRSETDGGIQRAKLERKSWLSYRKEQTGSELTYSGKILSRDALSLVQTAPSSPRSFSKAKPVASLECLQSVACRACADACPDTAITFPKLESLPQLSEDRCTGCGACVAACPSGAAVMIRDDPQT